MNQIIGYVFGLFISSGTTCFIDQLSDRLHGHVEVNVLRMASESLRFLGFGMLIVNRACLRSVVIFFLSPEPRSVSKMIEYRELQMQFPYFSHL